MKHATTKPPRLKELFRLDMPLKFLLLSSFLIPLASFMVLPFMSIYLNQTLGVDIRQVGLLLAVSNFIQFSGGIVGGFAANRFGLRATMNLGLVLRTAGFVLLVFSGASYAYAAAALIVTSCGAALYLPANKAYIVNGVPESDRALFLSVSNAALNLGMSTGPLVAALLIGFSIYWVFSVTAILFAVLTVLHFAVLPAEERGAGEKVAGAGFQKGSASGPRAYFAFLLAINVATLYVYMFFQNYMGVFTAERHSAAVYGLVLTLNCGMVILLQPLLANRIGRLPYPAAVAFGFSAFASGMCLISTGQLRAIFLGTALISLGEIVLFLKNDLALVGFFSRTPALAFGYQRLAAGVGALLSGALGGLFYSHAQQGAGTNQFWIIVAMQCVIPVLFLPLILGEGRRMARPRP